MSDKADILAFQAAYQLAKSRNYDPKVYYRSVKQKTLNHLRGSLEVLRRIDLAEIPAISEQYDIHFAEDRISIIPLDKDLCPSSDPTDLGGYYYTAGLWDPRSLFVFHESTESFLTQKECAVIMAHEGMECYMDKIRDSIPDSPASRSYNHYNSVLFDRKVSRILFGRPYIREETVRRVCRRFKKKISEIRKNDPTFQRDFF